MFRLKAEIDDWFKNIYGRGVIKTKWDEYYLCLLLGLSASRHNEIVGDRVDMVDYFIDDYRKSQYSIISLFLCAELGRLGIQFTDKNSAKAILDQYLDADAPAKLTNKAFQRLNEYAYGGYLVLNEKFSNKPADQTTFLQQYDQLVVELAAKNPVWA
jgi:hypothetical protein